MCVCVCVCVFVEDSIKAALSLFMEVQLSFMQKFNSYERSASKIAIDLPGQQLIM